MGSFLKRIKDFKSLATGKWRWVGVEGPHKELVELRRVDVPDHLGLDHRDLLEQLIQVLTRFRRGKQHRRPIEEKQLFPERLEILLAKRFLPFHAPALAHPDR